MFTESNILTSYISDYEYTDTIVYSVKSYKNESNIHYYVRIYSSHPLGKQLEQALECSDKYNKVFVIIYDEDKNMKQLEVCDIVGHFYSVNLKQIVIDILITDEEIISKIVKNKKNIFQIYDYKPALSVKPITYYNLNLIIEDVH